MKFTDEELPEQMDFEINTRQIGFVKYKHYSGIHLLLKSFLMLPFWITMRLMLQDKILDQRKRKLSLIDIEKKLINEKLKREAMGKFPTFITAAKKFAVFSWMWIIVFTLFMMGTFGDQMSFFRIINIGFCIVFILMFQLSLKLWLKMMYVFWSTLILYAMAALTLIYAYQFDDFPSFPLQMEIGLKKYQTWTLFVKLLSFTLVILMTGFQINYFHHQFVMHFEESLDDKEEEIIQESSTDRRDSVSIKNES
jgi:hypothetical protein